MSQLTSIFTDDMSHSVHLNQGLQEGVIDKRLLEICHSYNNFQKDAIDGLALYFKEINALVRTNPFAELSNVLHSPQLERFNKAYKIDLKHKPHNIDVIPTPIWYFPGNISYKSLGERHFKIVNRVIKKGCLNFDLIHSHFTWSSGYVGARLKEEYDLPFVVTGHGYDVYSLPFRDDEWREKIRWVLNKADRIITVSHSNLEYISKLRVSTPVTVIPNGFKNDLFYPRDSSECRKILNIPENKKIILTVGNLIPIKGHQYLIDAFYKIMHEKKDALCIIIGTGKLRNTLERQIRSLGMANQIMLIGSKPHDDIPIWINACDVFVLPSLNEGNPTVMFEALGCGKPFIGTKVGGVPEVIVSNDYGLLVEPENSDDLASKILLALDCEWRQEQIAEYAMRYAWKNITKEIMGIYEELLM